MSPTLKRTQTGLSLLEIIIAMVLGTAVSGLAYTYFRNFLGDMERQKRVNVLQENIRSAVESVNRFVISGGVAGDSLFFDPHGVLSLPFVNGGHQVFNVSTDSTAITVYGNFSGEAATLTAPVLDVGVRAVTVSVASLFKRGACAYIYAGSAQEVARILSVSGATLTLEHDLLTTYPKGTLILPMERVRIQAQPGPSLLVSRETALGDRILTRAFQPTSRPGDSLDFKVKSLDRQGGQIAYALTFAGIAPDKSRTMLVRRSEQAVFVRGF